MFRTPQGDSGADIEFNTTTKLCLQVCLLDEDVHQEHHGQNRTSLYSHPLRNAIEQHLLPILCKTWVNASGSHMPLRIHIFGAQFCSSALH
jgi:hypothetical protein